MQKENKDVEISNNAFDLKIHVNFTFLSGQAALIVCCLALLMFSKNSVISALIKLIIFIDIVIALLTMFAGRGDKDEEDTTEAKEETKAEPGEQATVSHEKAKTSSVKNTEHVIKHRVEVPNPNAARHHAGAQSSTIPQSQPSVTEAVNPTATVVPDMPTAPPPPPPPPPPPAALKPLTEADLKIDTPPEDAQGADDVSDWANFF